MSYKVGHAECVEAKRRHRSVLDTAKRGLMGYDATRGTGMKRYFVSQQNVGNGKKSRRRAHYAILCKCPVGALG
jgi:hypothetical protein